ncbi:unnamed protein product [Caenorhabditis angaria]|uniref:Uncharacterized protein n=1 Tax=Caenorhabditis angaria TaxID=860376 RepID=A0A9P1MYQ4_9PELO|nr:unnamed protein product [Caenorhabditis angaria]
MTKIGPVVRIEEYHGTQICEYRDHQSVEAAIHLFESNLVYFGKIPIIITKLQPQTPPAKSVDLETDIRLTSRGSFEEIYALMTKIGPVAKIHDSQICEYRDHQSVEAAIHFFESNLVYFGKIPIIITKLQPQTPTKSVDPKPPVFIDPNDVSKINFGKQVIRAQKALWVKKRKRICRMFETYHAQVIKVVF